MYFLSTRSPGRANNCRPHEEFRVGAIDMFGALAAHARVDARDFFAR